MYRVTVDRDRPDFRVFIDLLYGADRNVDTEGNSIPVNSRTWTYLYIKDRESDEPSMEISLNTGKPETFDVSSRAPRLQELAARRSEKPKAPSDVCNCTDTACVGRRLRLFRPTAVEPAFG